MALTYPKNKKRGKSESFSENVKKLGRSAVTEDIIIVVKKNKIVPTRGPKKVKIKILCMSVYFPIFILCIHTAYYTQNHLIDMITRYLHSIYPPFL